MWVATEHDPEGLKISRRISTRFDHAFKTECMNGGLRKIPALTEGQFDKQVEDLKK
jgi:hypothetical protein